MKEKTVSRKTDHQSLHLQILDLVQENIISGRWPPGFRIPFETEIAETYGCSRMTVNKALTQLTQSGLLIRNRKSGTFVRAPQSLSAVLEITNIKNEVIKSGRRYSYQLLSDVTRKVEQHDHSHLASKAVKSIRDIKCLHSANGKPFCYEERLINLNAVPEIKSIDFALDSPGSWLLQQVPWNSAQHQIIAVAATQPMAQTLNIKIGQACLVVERTTKNRRGYVTWARLSYPGDQHSLFATFTPTR